jgi:hypothetical protein
MTPAPSALVGRDQPLAELRALVEAALTSRGGVVTLTGEAGIGKTTLATAAADHAEARGATVVWGTGDPLAGPISRLEAEGRTLPLGGLDAPDAYGAAIVPLVERYVAGRDGITEDEAAAWAAELGELGKRGELFFACVQFCFTATRPA